MKTRYAVAFLLLIFSGCSTIRDAKTLKAATQFFANLSCDNKLPDLKQEHGDSFFTYVDPPGSSDKYPLHVMAVCTKTNEAQRYYYQLRKITPEAMWEITDGWRTGKNGQKQKLSIPSPAEQAKANESIGKH